MNAFPYHRIVVVGTTSSGKSTLASQLAEVIGTDYIDLDALHWEPNWVGAKPEVFRERVETATSSRPVLSKVERAWVVAGNYHVVRDIIWQRAEIIVWLDYPLHISFGDCLRVRFAGLSHRRSYGTATANPFGNT